jgi:hypothetical protein
MRRIATALGYIDGFVWLVIWLAGLAFAVYLAVNGATARWAVTMNVWDWLYGRDP